jgi:hypothetical protein
MLVAALASGALFERFGWWGVNLAAVPFVLLAGATIVLFSLGRDGPISGGRSIRSAVRISK